MADSTNIGTAIRGLNDLLKRELRDGRTAVWLPEETLQGLRQLPGRLASSTPVAAPPQPPANPAETPAPGTQSKATPVAEPSPAKTSTAPVSAPKVNDPPVPSGPAPATAATHAPAPADDQAQRDQLNALAREAKRDSACRALGTLHDTMVFATGNPNADLMFVGEAPGYQEELEKKPFVGPAGNLLTKIIEAMGLKRDAVYISNIVKFRPKIDDGSSQGRSNRKPTAEEMAASVKYVRAEINIVRPSVVVALGGTAASGLLGLQGSIGQLRNQFHDLDGTPVMVTYHPAYLLYREKEGPDAVKAEKRKVWDDMRLVLEKLGHPLPG